MKILRGIVIHGEKIGRTLGYPTANLTTRAWRRSGLGTGLYAGISVIRGVRYPAVVILGVPGKRIQRRGKAEVYLVGWHGRLYGKRLEVQIRKKLRPVLAFRTRTALLRQIKRDIRQTVRLAS